MRARTRTRTMSIAATLKGAALLVREDSYCPRPVSGSKVSARFKSDRAASISQSQTSWDMNFSTTRILGDAETTVGCGDFSHDAKSMDVRSLRQRSCPTLALTAFAR